MDDIVDEIGNILSIFVGEDNIIHVARIINVMDNIVDEIGNILSIFVGKDNVVYIHVARITY
jgi:GTP cyclohydrolase III